jgi:hypothetical protein
MTTRIQDLVLQVGTDTSGKWMRLDQVEKFAELIVRECIHVAYNKMTIQKLDGIRPSVVCDAIKEHFGVKS